MTTLEEIDALQERIRKAPADLIAARIRRARRLEERTLDELGAMVGSSRHHLIKLEKAQHRPRAALLTKIAEATGRQVEWFLDPDIDPSPFSGRADPSPSSLQVQRGRALVMLTAQIFKGDGRQPFYVRLVSSNGQVLAISEGYLTKWNAKRAARRMFPHLPVKEIA